MNRHAIWKCIWQYCCNCMPTFCPPVSDITGVHAWMSLLHLPAVVRGDDPSCLSPSLGFHGHKCHFGPACKAHMILIDAECQALLGSSLNIQARTPSLPWPCQNTTAYRSKISLLVA